MARFPSIAITAAAIAALTTMGLPTASATTGDDAAEFRSAADISQFVNLRPGPRPTATPTASPTSPATATPTASPTAPACAFTTSSFNGAVYCPITIANLKNTSYGTGIRVVLKSVTVTAVNSSTVTVAAWALPPCTPGNFCGQTLTLHSLTVPWTAASRPEYGDVLDLFGVTIPASITPDGYITTGNCPIDYC